jgi:NTP-dependent ternary system trypsin peptidase co-occuring protein
VGRILEKLRNLTHRQHHGRNSTQVLTLKDLLIHARNQIEEAATERTKSQKEPLLRVDSVTVEVNVTLTESTEGSGGFDIKVITLEGKESYEEEQVHKISVELSSLTRAEQRSRKYPDGVNLVISPDVSVASSGPSPSGSRSAD